jgi:hypothetical protein
MEGVPGFLRALLTLGECILALADALDGGVALIAASESFRFEGTQRPLVLQKGVLSLAEGTLACVNVALTSEELVPTAAALFQLCFSAGKPLHLLRKLSASVAGARLHDLLLSG